MNFNGAEDTFLNVKKTLNCSGRILDLSTPAIMGILNLTPDSFYDGGININENQAIKSVEKMLADGASIIDIGGQSTRPGARQISPDEEWQRIFSPLVKIRKTFPEAIISVDTFYSEVAEKTIAEGVSIINDISGGQFDSKMFAMLSRNQVPYILMHSKGNPETMQENPYYDDVAGEVLTYFIKEVTKLKKAGLTDVIIDPGFGFGKNNSHNYTLLKNLKMFQVLECPILAGISRKSMVTKILDLKPTEALNGTTALHTIALLNGASILRVHDVREAIQVRRIVDEYLNS